MIIMTGGIAAGDGPRITAYAVAQGKNERVQVLHDSADQLLIADEFAAARGRKNGLLHIIISPGQELTADELAATVEAIRAEFEFNPNDPETLTMHEKADADGVTRKHWHLVRPAADSESGCTYKLFRSKAKDEAISRRMELELGHKLTSGPRNDFAELRLREMGKDELADKLAAELGGKDKPRAAFSSDEHRQAKRNGFDLPALRQSLKEIAALPRNQQPAALAELIHDQALEVADAINEGRGRSRINIETPAGVKDHNANRTLKIPAAEVAAFIAETKGHLHDRRSDHTADRHDHSTGSASADYHRTRTGHRRSEADSREQSSNDSTPERTSESAASDHPELNAAAQLAVAARELRPQIEKLAAKTAQFASNRADDLTAGDLEAPPDPRDPNLLMKLARMLKKSLRGAQDALKRSAPAPGPGI